MKKHLPRGLTQNPVSVVNRQEWKPIANQRYGILIAVPVENLERRIACPHESSRDKCLKHSLNQRGEVRVWRTFPTQRIECRDLHIEIPVCRHSAQRLYIFI